MENFKKINLKNGKIAKLCILSKKQNDNDFVVLAVSENKQVGYCYFTFKDNDCHIVRIAVTNKEFLSTGIGHAMFDAMEYFAFDCGKKYITGTFVARGYENANELTSKFYMKHGILPEDGESFFDREDIFKIIKTPTKKFDIPKICDEKLYEKLSKYNFSSHDMFSSGEKENNDDFHI
ncbi:MAG: GNAT family N-acetyltransferase [Clostridia bacterium]|nr:GNAT family N-acetyltransferase [Clostridia bacterium]